MSQAADLATSRCIVSEGFRAHAYHDSRGFLTIGYGFDIDAGISQYAASKLLQAQVSEAETACQSYVWYQAADPVRQSVLVELTFNMGLEKLLEFQHMLDACASKDWTSAGQQLQNSAWFGEVGERGPELVALLTNGQ